MVIGLDVAEMSRGSVNDHRAAAKDLQAKKSRAARDTVCNLLLYRVTFLHVIHLYNSIFDCVNLKTKSAVEI